MVMVKRKRDVGSLQHVYRWTQIARKFLTHFTSKQKTSVTQKSETKGHFLSQNIVSLEKEANTGHQMIPLRGKERKKERKKTQGGWYGIKVAPRHWNKIPSKAKRIKLLFFFWPSFAPVFPKLHRKCTREKGFLSSSPQMPGNYSNLNTSWWLSLLYLQIHTSW